MVDLLGHLSEVLCTIWVKGRVPFTRRVKCRSGERSLRNDYYLNVFHDLLAHSCFKKLQN